MKYYFLTAVAVLVMSASKVCAQGVHFGIKGGANLYDVYVDQGPNNDYKFGFHGGFLTHIHIAKHFAIQPEVYYSRQGAMLNYFNPDATLRLNYINVPVLFQYMVGNGLRFQAGPQLSFLTNTALKTDTYTAKNLSGVRPLDFGATVGVSYVSPINLGVDFRYNHGFVDITDGTPMSSNRGFQLGLFYLFGQTN